MTECQIEMWIGKKSLVCTWNRADGHIVCTSVDDAMPWTGLGALRQTSKVTKLERGCTVGLIAPF